MLKSIFFEINADSDFSIYNLPFGIFSSSGKSKRVGVRIGDFVIDVAGLFSTESFPIVSGLTEEALLAHSLNHLAECGIDTWKNLRRVLQDIYSGSKPFPKEEALAALIPIHQVQLYVPFQISDYTDFYSSEYHARNVGSMFRDPSNPLLPNWKHVPVGYHGRSSSIVVSGTPFHRPMGQIKAADQEFPTTAFSKQVDLELETGFFMAKQTKMGQRILVDEASDYIFGMVLFNDWSARDIQSWEYVPLGPFLGKNFCSSLSPWVVTLDALEPFKIEMPSQADPEPQDYLKQSHRTTHDIQLEVEMVLANGERKIISKSNQKYLYWSIAQQLAHHSINGCPMQVGDLLASGTISGPTKDSLGCLLELTERGKYPIEFADGSIRKFMEDGDEIILRGFGIKDGIRVGFGEVSGKLLPGIPF